MAAIAMNGTASANGSLYTVMKELYVGQQATEQFFKDWTLLSLLQRNTKFGGRGYPLPFIASVGSGANPTFANSQTNSAPGKSSEFLITTADIYASGYLDVKTLKAAKTDKQTFVNATKFNVDGAIEGVTKNLAMALYRTNIGTLATISAMPGSGVVKFTNASDAQAFEVGCVYDSSSAGTYGSLRAGVSYCISVSVSDGTATFAATYGGTAADPTAWAVGDQVCIDGTFVAAGGQHMNGLLTWCPSSIATSGDSFFGVDRYKFQRERVAGTYMDGSKKLISESISNWLAKIAMVGGKPTHVLVNPISYQGLINELTQKGVITYGEAKSKTVEIGFEGIKFRFAGGTVLVLSDPACPAATAFTMNMDRTWLGSIEEAVSVFNEDGRPELRVYNASQVEIRVLSFSQIYTDDMKSLGVCALQF
jgi:hypothetical protein